MATVDVAKHILRGLGKSESLITHVKDRSAHDLRYSLDCSKVVREWGWSLQTDFEEGLRKTISWYLKRPDWVRQIKDASYLSYYNRMYTNRDDTLNSF